MDDCSRCGQGTYRPEPGGYSGRMMATRCGGCDKIVGRCSCIPGTIEQPSLGRPPQSGPASRPGDPAAEGHYLLSDNLVVDVYLLDATLNELVRRGWITTPGFTRIRTLRDVFVETATRLSRGRLSEPKP